MVRTRPGVTSIAAVVCALVGACTDPAPTSLTRTLQVEGTVVDSTGQPVVGAHVWARAWPQSDSTVERTGQGSVRTDRKGRFVAAAGSSDALVLDSLEIRTLVPGCPVQDPQRVVQRSVAVGGDVVGMVRSTLIVRPVARPRSPATQSFCAVGVVERFGYYDYISSHRFELRLDSVAPGGGAAFGRWILTGSTRPGNWGTATGVVAGSFVVLALRDTSPGLLPCSPFRLIVALEPDGRWGQVATDGGAYCGLRPPYTFVDWTGQQSYLR